MTADARRALAERLEQIKPCLLTHATANVLMHIRTIDDVLAVLREETDAPAPYTPEEVAAIEKFIAERREYGEAQVHGVRFGARRALTDEEMRFLFNEGKGLTYDELVKPRVTLVRPNHDSECEAELTSHGYTPCRCAERTETPALRLPPILSAALTDAVLNEAWHAMVKSPDGDNYAGVRAILEAAILNEAAARIESAAPPEARPTCATCRYSATGLMQWLMCSNDDSPLVAQPFRQDQLNLIGCTLHEPAERTETPALPNENERELFERLSKALTGGNASTWDEVLHAAESLPAPPAGDET